MIETLSINLLVAFFVVVLTVLFWRLVRDKDYENFSLSGISIKLKVYVLFLLPILSLYAVGGIIGLSFANSFLYLIAGLLIPAFLSVTGLSSVSRAMLILLLSVAASLFIGEDGYRMNFASLIAGLVTWKSIDYLLYYDQNERPGLEDFLPAFLFLVGIYWTKTTDPVTWLPMHEKLILGALTVSVFMKWAQKPFLNNDKLYLKRISLAATGALFLLIYINRFMVAMELSKIAVICGAGMFLAYLFDAMQESCSGNEKILSDIKKVLFVGIFTLLVSRLFGMLGLIVLAMGLLVSSTGGVALIASMFFGARVFAQSFIFDFNSNMTGINIMHTYAGAALFAGFFLVLALSLLIKNAKSKMVCTILFISASVLAPVTSIYFLHAEPTASLFYSSLVASVLIALMAPSIFDNEEIVSKQAALILIPPQLLAFGIMTNELISRGNTADIKERILILAVVSIVASLVLWISYRLAKKELSEVPSSETAGAESQL